MLACTLAVLLSARPPRISRVLVIALVQTQVRPEDLSSVLSGGKLPACCRGPAGPRPGGRVQVPALWGVRPAARVLSRRVFSGLSSSPSLALVQSPFSGCQGLSHTEAEQEVGGPRPRRQAEVALGESSPRFLIIPGEHSQESGFQGCCRIGEDDGTRAWDGGSPLKHLGSFWITLSAPAPS